MDDLGLWRLLLDESALPNNLERVLPFFEELAREPLQARTPFLGLLQPLCAHADARARVAALRVIAGATGFPAWELIVRALHDGEAGVRIAAFDALRASAENDAARMAHALFHADEAIRRKAIEGLPPKLGSHVLYHLLADRPNRQIVAALLRDVAPSARAASILRDHAESGELDRELLATLVARLPWQKEGDAIVLGELSGRARTRPASLTPASAEQALADLDDLDPLLRPLLGADAPAQAQRAFFGEVRAGIARGGLHTEAHVRLALAVLGASRQAGWTAEALALVAGVFPTILGTENVPLDLRREAAAKLIAPPELPIEDPLALVPAPIWRTDDQLYLESLVGLLRLAPQPHLTLLQHVSLSEIGAAARSDATGACELASLEATSKQDQQARGSVVLAVVDATTDLAVLAELATRLSGDQLDWIAELELERALALLATACAARSTASEQRTERLADRLAARFARSRQTLGAALERLARAPDACGSWLARAVCAALARAVKPRVWINAVRAAGGFEPRVFALIEASAVPWPLMRALIDDLVRQPVSGSEALLTLFPAAAEAEIVPERVADALSADEEREIIAASDADLPAAVHCCIGRPVRGLCGALARRSPPRTPQVEVCVAILQSADPEEEVARELARHGSDDPSFLSKLDQAMVRHAPPPERAPLLASVWLHLWERHLLRLAERLESRAPRRRLAWLLELGLRLPSPVLTWQAWQAALNLVRLWRYRDRTVLAVEARDELLEIVFDGLLANESRAGIAALRPNWLVDLQVTAAEIVVVLHRAGVAFRPSSMDAVLEAIPYLPAEVTEILRDWIDLRGLRLGGTEAAAPRVVTGIDPSSLSDLDALGRLAVHSDVQIARPAIERLLELDEPGHLALLDAALGCEDRVACARITATIQRWTDGALERLRTDVRSETVAPMARFSLALALARAGESWALEHALAAATARSDRPWFTSGDWDALLSLGRSPLELAIALATSPHVPAYLRAVRELIQADPHMLGPRTALVAFLACGSERAHAQRLEAARRLHQLGDHTGFALLCAEQLASDQQVGGTESGVARLLSKAPPELVRVATRSVLIRGGREIHQHHLVAALRRPEMAAPVREENLLDVVACTSSAQVQEQAIESIVACLHGRNGPAVRRLAEVFAWGTRRALELTSRLLAIHPARAGALGHTDLDSSEVFVTPLPILHGERDGVTVVRALILHELGHHKFHRTEAAREVARRAAEEHLSALLNLVDDEHLERRLRAASAEDGDALKVLAAYAFQHSEHEVLVGRLLADLGGRAFAALVGQRIGAARVEGAVRVEAGQVLRALERAGSSFARFVRALRMGLGNRHQDPRVARALSLFTRAFQRASPLERLEIARELRAIFGSEGELLGILHAEGAARSGLEEREVLAGWSNDAIQAEVERALRAGSLSQVADGLPEPDRSDQESFPRIQTIVPVPYDSAAHRERALAVARHSLQLRRYLRALGLALEPARLRVQGRALDRGRLEAALVRADPRVLVARRPVARNNLFLGVLVDCSGSMTHRGHIELAKQFAVLIAEAARGLRGIDVRIAGFTDSTIFDAGTASRCAVAALATSGGNNDAAALFHMAELAQRSRRSSRLIVMVSDGLPTACSVAALRALVARLTREGLCCAQVAVHPIEEVCFPHYVELTEENTEVSIRKFGETISRLVWRTIRGG